MREGKLKNFLFPNEEDRNESSSSINNERKGGYLSPVNNSQTSVSDLNLDVITAEEEKFEPSIRNRRGLRGSSNNSVAAVESIVFTPNTYEDAEKIAKELLAGRPAIVNLENMHRNEATKSSAIRVIDYLSGVSYAANVDIQRINNSTFVFKPNSNSEENANPFSF